MKSSRKILILLAVLVILLGGFFALKHFSPSEDEEDVTKITAARIDTDSISAVTVSGSGAEYAFEKNGDLYKSKGGYADSKTEAAAEENVKSLLSALKALTAERTVTEKTDSLKQYGLDKPFYSIRLTYTDKAEENLYFGNEAVTGDCYFKTSSSDTVYLVGSDIGPVIRNVLSPQTEDSAEPVSDAD